MRFPLIASAALIPFLIVACQDQGKPPPLTAQASEAASGALGVLRQLVTAQNYRAMGFDSLEEVSRAKLGQPLNVNNIGLDRLREYQPGGNPEELLSPAADIVYPVVVDGAVKSSLTIVKKDGGYASSAFGNADVAKRLWRYQPAATPDTFIVRVPALSIYFVGQRTSAGLLLTPIVSDPRLRIPEGKPLPADLVLAQLVPLAKAYNGLPL